MLISYSEFVKENFKIPWLNSLPIGSSRAELYKLVNFIANQFDDELLVNDKIDTGSHGTAFELKSGRVLKLTNDEDEARMAQFLSDRNTKYLINCDVVCEIVPDNVYALIMQKLDIHEDIMDFRIIWDYLLTYINKDPQVILDQDKEFIISEIDSDYDIVSSYDEIRKYIEDNWDSIYGIAIEIASLGINYPDIHVGNLGFSDNGDLIHMDVREMKKQLDLSHIELQKLDISSFFEETINH